MIDWWFADKGQAVPQLILADGYAPKPLHLGAGLGEHADDGNGQTDHGGNR